MKQSLLLVMAAITAVGSIGGRPAFAQKTSSSANFTNDFLWQLDFAQQRVVDLAQAIPAEKYTWRPTPETCSIAEVFLHIAAGNYVAAQALGTPAPAGFDLLAFEKTTWDQSAVIESVRRSFDQLHRAASSVRLDQKVQMFGHEATAQRVLVTVTMHEHEHIGQSIAYARAVGVVPPWTAAGRMGPGQQNGREALIHPVADGKGLPISGAPGLVAWPWFVR